MYADQIANRPDHFEIAVIAPFTVTGPSADEIAAGLLPVKMMLGFYIGGMGASGQNYHTKLMARMGYEDEANHIQELFMSGDQEGAVAAVPDAFADEISLVGPKERIAERLEAWRDSPVTTLMIHATSPNHFRISGLFTLSL